MRNGITTGTCAAAAAGAAVMDCLTNERQDRIQLKLPNGTTISIPVIEYQNDKNEQLKQLHAGAAYAVIKDSGDDPDVTDKSEICAHVQILNKKTVHQFICEKKYFYHTAEGYSVYLLGGEGVGTVTMEGLEQNTGYPAINKIPRSMIFDTVDRTVNQWNSRSGENFRDCLIISIFVPNGKELAKKTFNPQLGITGGISILGTSGIVEPMSEKALIATIQLEIRQTIILGQKNIIFVPGNYGEQYAKKQLHISERIIQCSNYIGEAIDFAVKAKAESILLVGNYGKMIKLAGGIMNTHSRTADCRWELTAVHAALCGADVTVIQRIKDAVTTEQMLRILYEADQSHQLYDRTLQSILGEIELHLKRRAGDINIAAAVYSESKGLLGKTSDFDRIYRD